MISSYLPASLIIKCMYIVQCTRYYVLCKSWLIILVKWKQLLFWTLKQLSFAHLAHVTLLLHHFAPFTLLFSYFQIDINTHTQIQWKLDRCPSRKKKLLIVVSKQLMEMFWHFINTLDNLYIISGFQVYEMALEQ